MAKPKKKPEVAWEPPPEPWVRYMQHAGPGAVIAIFLLLWMAAPDLVPALGQEDSWIEWLTVIVFGAASVAFAFVGYERGWRQGWFAWGLALFCFLVAGEELSWGQRLIGFTPPEIFLQKNYQEEANIHNLFTKQLKTKWIVSAILAGWGVVLPALKGMMRETFSRLGLIAPPLSLAIWCIIGIYLVIDYPLEMTAEWIELATGFVFLVTALPMLKLNPVTWTGLLVPAVAVGAAALYLNFQDSWGSPQKLACAQAETKALAEAIEKGGARGKLLNRNASFDYRVYTAIESGNLESKIVEALDQVACEGVSHNPDRRKYGMDPWGQAYWIYFDPDGPVGTALFYSFGPNRRYDSPNGKIDGTDDVGARSRPLDRRTGLPE